MRIKNFIAVLLVFCSLTEANAQQKKYVVRTVAFYNFENLFDTINNPNFDEEWTPKGLQRWTSVKYKQKLENLSTVLMQIGVNDKQKEGPTFIGGSEIENRNVLEDLVKHPNILKEDYGIVHFDSPDKRGIDVALLYKKKYFKPTSFINIPLIIYRGNGTEKEKETEEDKIDKDKIEIANDHRVYTRDILLVTGFLDGEEINILVNHWPSRSGGEKKSSPFREAAGRLARKTMDSIYKINPKAKIILMGDLNDGTYNKSVKVGIGAKLKKSEVQQFGVFNPFEQMFKDGNSTLFYRDSGDIFDQIMVSETLIKEDRSTYQYWKAGIYNKPFMIEKFGRYAGYPLRHSENEIGYSDHFPVYIYLVKEVK
ncbi:endonuclease/exonuclease/phosphatase family protein [Flavobacterium franklandianum]|uniref:Endonuclease/exonuclease/phosphatase family protein n=1 Tax=Flavobacterium franklandianum TaxID=2594430 RepID=A0A553CTI0_9FLAO|nr:endonuclease/exonuclease/phosphatase family protein [Flavobacterium franklandianum]TRX23823.1 endonuclease/exonuclease/phosphatase family protein [Flavobacterium franklandianum]TRX27907.1 endonuclease/exonuclease/phosphatase family protein [Flavobacterium franklandianum]